MKCQSCHRSLTVHRPYTRNISTVVRLRVGRQPIPILTLNNSQPYTIRHRPRHTLKVLLPEP